MMKKLVLNLVAVCVTTVAMAQSPFFESTTYRGAFAPIPAARWTDGWTNFDPQNANYPVPTLQVVNNITTNTTWTADNVYQINDALIYVKAPAVLTIEAGTIIRGNGKGTLIIERGAKIIAQGTEASPIIFTSNAPAGSRSYGNWGGVVMCGAAQHNLAAGPNAIVEGGIGDAATQTGVHGGNNDDDSSGIFSYCRIEFCGISLTAQPNSEINGLSMYSIGRKTKIDHVQVSYSGDDSFEWFGGTVDCKYLVAFRGWDDDFDTDNGYRGRVQFGLGWRDPNIADQSGSNGFESDNDAAGSNNVPQTAAVFSNMTIVGPLQNSNYVGTVNALFRRGAHIRRNSAESIFNSIILGYPDAGLLVDSRKTNRNFCTSLNYFNNQVMAGHNTDWKLATGSDTLCMTSSLGVRDYFMTSPNTNDTLTLTADVLLNDPYNFTNPDARPQGNSIASSNAAFTNSLLLPLAVQPNASFSVSATNNEICAGGDVTFTATAQPNTTLFWTVNGGNPANGSSETLTTNFASPGTYTVTLTATNSLGSATTNQTITVNALPSASISQTGTILNATAGFAAYQWQLNGNNVSGATNQTWNADTTAGSYTVTVTNAAGCSSTSAPYTYTTGLAAFSLSSSSICVGETVTFTATTQNAASYSWIFTGGNPATSNQPTVTVTFNTAGSYSAVLNVTDAGNLASSTAVVNVNALPTPVIVANGDVLSTTQGFNTFQWFLDGNAINGATGATHTATATGAYTVEVTNAAGCTNTSDAYNLYLSVNEVENTVEINVYPNPASDMVNVSLQQNSAQLVSVQLVNISGQIVGAANNAETTAGNSVITLNTSGLAAGFYVVYIRTGNQMIARKLIIK
jgi:PKD repeat protein